MKLGMAHVANDNGTMSDKETAQKLRECLGVRTYQAYEKLVRRLQKKLTLLQRKLGLAEDGTVSQRT